MSATVSNLIQLYLLKKITTITPATLKFMNFAGTATGGVL